MQKVTLWIPAAESPRWPCVESWLRMDIPDDVEMSFVRSNANNIKYSWNKVVRDFLQSGNDWLFSSHNDVVFAPGTLPRLLSWGKPLISALIFMRHSPVVPHIWKSYAPGEYYAMRVHDTRTWFSQHQDYIKPGAQIMHPRPDDALVPVDFTSTSCMLIHRTVLESMQDPWFLWDDDFEGGGEDRRFCQNALAAGFTTYVDRSCIAGHLVGDIPTGALDFIAWESVSRFDGTGEK